MPVPPLKQEPAKVIAYSRPNLAYALSNENLTAEDIKIEKIRHYHFLLDYFDQTKGGHKACSIVLEHKYLSKSYLKDYSNFYSTCYVDYKRFCKRVHFFSAEFNQKVFDRMLFDPQASDKDIWESYLGYVVIRPLSNAIIGATLLKHWETRDTGRYYNAIRDYTINLCGKDLKLRTLIFQEQDHVVGACASSALWSAFHKISMQEVFQTPLPTPSEITKSVKSHFNDFSGRIFPNDGLTLEQVLESIDAVGLVSELITSKQIKRLKFLKAIVYAYNKMGLPVLLQFKFTDKEHHLVTITGYHKDPQHHVTDKNNKMVLASDNIIKFYAHDDQVGPFARLEFTQGPQAIRYPLTTAWIKYHKAKPGQPFQLMLATPEAVIIPINDQVRIKFNNIYDNLLALNAFFRRFLIRNEFIVWDFYLEHSNEYKKEIFGDPAKPEIPPAPLRIRRKILKRCFPKYIWVAKASIRDKLNFEIVFDATNVADANFGKFFNFYNEDLRKMTRNVFRRKNSGAERSLLENLGRKYLQIIQEEIK